MLSSWQRDHLSLLPASIALAMFAAFAAALVLVRRGGDSALIAIGLMMIAASFEAMRNLPLAVIACAPGLARHWSEFRRTRVSGFSRHNQFVLGGMATVILIAGGLFSARLRAGEPMPEGAVDVMIAHDLHGNILSTFNWGEYLIWHLAPASKVFMDGRYDTVYPPKVIDDYLTFQYGESGAKEVLRKYPHDFILLSPNDEVALALIAAASEWKRIYRDGTCILFARADSEAAKIPVVEVTAQSTPASYFP